MLPGKSLQQALAGRDNAFGFLRLVLALAVIVDHSFPLGGFGESPVQNWTRGQANLGVIAVSGFFALSGYLIVKSALAADLVQFFWRRALRIFPAYWTVLLLTSLVIGPLLWRYEQRPLAAYYTWGIGGPAGYLYRNALLHYSQIGIHDLLKNTTPFGRETELSIFNGSLWTLMYEWHCYVLVGILSALGIFKKRPSLVAALIALLLIFQIGTAAEIAWINKLAAWVGDGQTINLTVVFLYGGLAALYARHIPIRNIWAILSAILLAASLLIGGFNLAGGPAMTYLLLWLAYSLPPVFKKLNATNDYSYGLYIYAFLLQQLLAYCGAPSLGLIAYMLLSLTLTFIPAALSWHLIEKPALAYKDHGPGRGFPSFRHSLNRNTPETQ